MRVSSLRHGSWIQDLCCVGGAALQVTLRGVALQEDKNKKQRNEIEVNNELKIEIWCVVVTR